MQDTCPLRYTQPDAQFVMDMEERSSWPAATSHKITATPNNMNINNLLHKHQQWLPTLGMVFLTFNSITAVYHSINDPWTVAFVVTVYVNVLLLLACVRVMERTPEGKRGWVKAAVWTLASTLTVMFSYRVALMMPFALAVIVWAMAGVTVFGGFYALIVYRDEPDLPFQRKGDDGLNGEPKVIVVEFFKN